MRVSLLAVAVLATIAISSAVDEECIQRKIRGLPVHWPNPTSCASFYRCTNKNIKRELLCPEGKEYNPTTGRCSNEGNSLCQLSLAAPLAETVDDSCAGKISGTFVPAEDSCRSFNLCNNNIAYPQTCDPGSYFNSKLAICEPDPEILCWENLCLNKTNDVRVANENDCYGFYECREEKAVAQKCSVGNYFNAGDLKCQPGKCPSEETTTSASTDTTTAAIATATATTAATKTDATTATPTTAGTTTASPTTSVPTTAKSTTAATTSNSRTTDTRTTTAVTTAKASTDATTSTVTETTTKTATNTTNNPLPENTTQACTGTKSTTTCAPETTTTKCTSLTKSTTTPKITTKTKSRALKTTTTTTTTTTTKTTTTCTPETTTTTCKPEPTTTTCTTETTTTCSPETTTTTCNPEPTTTTCTTKTTTTCTPETTTTTCKPEPTTTTCTTETTTTCAPETTTTTCKPEPTTTTCTTQTTTTCTPETTTTTCKPTTTTCKPETTTTACSHQETTISTDGSSDNDNCDSSKCRQAKNGFVLPARNTIAGFCVCLDQKAHYRECPHEAIFNETLKICAAQDDICPSSRCDQLPNYSTFPASNTSTGFCRCLNKQATFFECTGTNFVYDNNLGICVESKNTSECPESTKLCTGGYKEGDFVANKDSCILFYICYQGELVELDCEQGNYFDDKIKACLPDTDNKCPACHQAQPSRNNQRNKRSIRASTCPEGAKTPANDCDKYYKCSKGHKLLYGCGKDNVFNITTLACQLDVQHVCWPVNSCTEGERTPYVDDHTKYYECLNGKQVIMTCEANSIFNKLTKTCVARQECTCPGGYKEGDISAHPTDCDKFYICSDGEQMLHECGKGNYFDNQTLSCAKDVKNICHVEESCMCPGGYEDGELSPHPNDCDKYYICVNGQQVLQECGKDNYFDKNTLSCEPDTYNECWSKADCTCPGGYKEGEFSGHPTNCNQYYICHDGKQVLEDCGTNNFFNNDTLTCEPDVYHVCWPNLCAGQPNGALIANPQQCNTFFLCENDEATAKACFEGQWFDASAGACVADLKAVCYNPCANESAGPVVLLSHPICNEYYFCNGHKTFVGTCLVGSFDIETGVCNENKKCFPNPCDNPNVTVFPDPYDPTKFYWCNAQKKPIPYDCPTGMEFNMDLEICKKVSDPDCPVCTQDGSFPTLDDTNDSEFCVCVQGVATKIECAQGYVFNKELEVCYSNAPCDPSFCLDAKEYDIAPNRDCDKSFCMCFNKKAVIIDCPNNGTFNPYTLECSDYEISPECLQSTCVGKKGNNYVFNPINTKTSNGFCQCINQIATFRPCSYGSTFNPDLMICQLAEINCNSYQCRGLADKTVIPSVSTTEGYCECVAGIATYYNCPNNGEFNATTSQCEAPLCDLTQCSAKGSKLPFPASTPNGFCLCDVGFIPCEKEGTMFSDTFGTCIDPCLQASCNGKPDKYLVPSTISKSSFCVCHADLRVATTYEVCPSESFVFSESAQMCVADAEKLCGTSCKTLGAFAAKDTLSGFCLCTANGKTPTFEKCLGGVFVPEKSACMPTAADVCDVALCAQATLEHPITLPANNSISDFCYCSSPTNAMLLPCPIGKYYNQVKGMCVNQQDESCDKCPNNVADNEKVADSTTCNKYSICVKGVMRPETCPQGDYFSVEVNDCVPDLKGVCVRKSDCTCLGIYYENELVPHPVNPQMYYACQGNTLHEYKCQVGRVFSVTQKQCILNPHLPNLRQKRSVDTNNDHEFGCMENDKRSVPSNCSQYEICLQQMWQLKTCSNYRYYNPEQKKCLQPRDDFVCSYAKVMSLPTCNVTMENFLLKSKTCQHYYRCRSGKWRLRSCGRQQYFNASISSCLPLPDDPSFKCGVWGNSTNEKGSSKIKESSKCQHLSQRFYAKNCAMFLICLDNDWWYQYCPPDTFYNRTLNYCVRDVQQQCKDVIKAETNQGTEEFSKDSCQQDGLLRPSAMACNRYFICFNGKWLMQHCSLGEFYDTVNAKCSKDTSGICAQLNKDCLPNERKPINQNCSLYEQCSPEGKMLTKTCPPGQMYDDLLMQCVNNLDICSKHGLKRTCRQNEIISVNYNCSLFYYCDQETWNLGNCLQGFMFSPEQKICVAHVAEDSCKPVNLTDSSFNTERFSCQKKTDGTWVAHLTDCNRYYVCIQEAVYQEMECPRGSYFETRLGYCRPNNGSCRLRLTGACANASDESLVPHPLDCQAFYSCSSINGTELHLCPKDQYFNKYSQQCVTDKGECKVEKEANSKCAGLKHGTRLAHDTYCNIYYACVKGLAIPAECPYSQQFNNVLGKCVTDKEHQCPEGHHKEDNITQSCSNLADGLYLPHLKDCTRYYICSQGQALPKKCANSSYFDSEQLLCMPDDGSCPFVGHEEEKSNTLPPDPRVCEGKHGHLMADPLNCNNFYACIHNKLKHERCYTHQFFNSTSQQCQQQLTLVSNSSVNATLDNSLKAHKIKSLQCLDETTTLKKLCSEMSEGVFLAEPGDCRRYITCQETEQEPVSQRCRNGESFDSLLGFCRQNDGTCLLENGQRVGECSGEHGQLARDVTNCRNYFVCINGQKILQTCADDKYFSKTQNMCIKDTQHTCQPSRNPPGQIVQSCDGLSESVLYPFIHDNCRSYFQCTKGVAKIHKCADDLFFDPVAIKCTNNKTECVMPPQALQRTPTLNHSFNKLCSNKKLEYPYAYVDNDCRSFYLCHENGKVSHELCPLGMMFSQENTKCVAENRTSCKTQ